MIKIELEDEQYIWLKEFLDIGYSAFGMDEYRDWVARSYDELSVPLEQCKKLFNALERAEEQNGIKVVIDYDKVPEDDVATVYYTSIVRTNGNT